LASRERYDAAYYAVDIAHVGEQADGYARKLQRWFDFVGYELRPGSTVLDAGCGAGALAKLLLAHGQQVTGVDAFEYPLEQARRLVPEARFCRADLNHPLPFPDRTFDLVVAHEVIEHLRQPGLFVREARRVLRPGGHLLIKTPNAWDMMRVIYPLRGKQWYANMDKTHVRYFNPLGLRALLHNADFIRIVVRCGTRPRFRRVKRLNQVLALVGHGIAARAQRTPQAERCCRAGE
jgi:2-polyprenyl-3-methyl-5-hydroxy-6-metoxy-1,4-benzoquinol methylase